MTIASAFASLTSRLEAAERVVSVLTDDCAECKDHLAAATAEAERRAKMIDKLSVAAIALLAAARPYATESDALAKAWGELRSAIPIVIHGSATPAPSKDDT